MTPISLQDLAPSKSQFLSDVLAGLTDEPKRLPCKYLYDERGSALFEEICGLDEYYLTRAELEILDTHLDEIADCLGPHTAIVEFGSGSSLKTRKLLSRLESPVALIPVDISREHLAHSARVLAAQFPRLAVRPVCADFTQPFELPAIARGAEKTIVYFPGSTIGNFSPSEAAELLEVIGDCAGSGGGLLIGVDLKKPRSILEPAYDDARQVTAEFNLNLLRRMNRELFADFDVDRFRHESRYNDCEGRIEMHLVSAGDQSVQLDGTEIHFADGESIHTENSYKYSLGQFSSLAASCGFAVQRVWCDSRRYFSVQYLTRR